MARMSRQEVVDLIQSIEEGGGDATDLRTVLSEVDSEARASASHKTNASPSRGGLRATRNEEEETTEERLTRRVSDLFPEGIPFKEIYDYDYNFNQKDLMKQCREAGLGLSGDKKELAAKLIAHNRDSEHEGKEDIMEDIIDLNKQKEWEGKPGEVAIPEAYLKDLRYEVVVFSRKERGGSDFTFRCKDYQEGAGSLWKFSGVIIDTSKLNANGEVTLARVTYHSEVVLVNIGFMVVPAPEDAGT